MALGKAWLRGGLVMALALGVGAFCAVGLVRAQQDDEAPAPPVHQPPPLRSVEPPPAAADTSTGPDEAADQADVSDAPAKSSAAPPKPVIPLKRPRYAIAIFQALDKVTAETERFEVPINRPVRYKTLIFTVHACETTASDEDNIDAAAHVEVISQPKAADGARTLAPREVFKGWMFANSPGLNLFQHPVYDAWLIACKTEVPST